MSRQLSILLLVLLGLAFADAGVELWVDGSGPLKTLPGGSYEVSGTLTGVDERGLLYRNPMDDNEDAATQEQIAQVAGAELDGPHLSFTFADLKGKLWRGTLHVDVDAQPGTYALSILPVAAAKGALPPAMRLTVFADSADLRASYYCVSRRFLGVSPFVPAGLILLVALYGLVRSFIDAGKREARLQAQGLGTIYKLAKRKTCWELMFGLGERHGVKAGDTLLLLDPAYQTVGEVVVEAVGPETAEARLTLGLTIRPDFLVARPDAPHVA